MSDIKAVLPVLGFFVILAVVLVIGKAIGHDAEAHTLIPVWLPL